MDQIKGKVKAVISVKERNLIHKGKISEVAAQNC